MTPESIVSEDNQQLKAFYMFYMFFRLKMKPKDNAYQVYI